MFVPTEKFVLRSFTSRFVCSAFMDKLFQFLICEVDVAMGDISH